MVFEYSYDVASQLIGITYRKGTAVLGNLIYEYDKAGQRTRVSGSFARTGLPLAVTSASYNANNQQTNFGGQTFIYDNNGNLTNDGTNTYGWNSRDQLITITGPGLNASFQYDALGRRVSKTINGTTTAFLYDGITPVQELSGTTPTANMLTGLQIDQVFTRTDSAGMRGLLSDTQNSSVALTDSSGTLQTQYTYEPFGGMTFIGPSSTNSYQFTGRENDGTGSMYYRARYYNPKRQRFISEDPIGFAGGSPNLYSYVENSPLNFVDPLGNSLLSTAIKIFSEGVQVAKLSKRGSQAKKVERVKDSIDKVKACGGCNIAVKVTNERDAKRLASELSTNKRARGPEKSPGYPDHYNPEEGPYSDVHVQTTRPGKGGKEIISSIFIPNAMMMSQLAEDDPSITVFDVAIVGAWDVAKSIDPIFLTDAIEWACGVSK